MEPVKSEETHYKLADGVQAEQVSLFGEEPAECE
jgi:hypothetical protein